MFLTEIFSSNPHELYTKYCGDKLFENEIELIEHIFEAIAFSQNETDYDRLGLRAYLEKAKQVQDPNGTRFYVPFIFHPKRELLIQKLQKEFLLTKVQTERLHSCVFNFAVKSFLENKFGFGFIKTLFTHLDVLKDNFGNHFKQMEVSFEKTKSLFKGNKDLVEELESSHKKQIQEQKEIFYKTVPFSKLTETEGLEPIKADLFSELFKRGRPQTMAFNEFIFELYQICSENKSYMPFIQRVIQAIHEINPDYFLRTEISESAVRKKIKEMKKRS